jgi:hypothetical protein
MTESTSNPQQILALYADGPRLLESVLGGLDAAGLDLAPAPGQWSIRRIAHHVVDGDDLWKTCILAALGNADGPFTLKWYWNVPQDAWTVAWRYAERPLENALALFRANRARILELLRTVPDAWECSIVTEWPNRPASRIRVGDVVDMQANHAAGHAEEIAAMRKARGG